MVLHFPMVKFAYLVWCLAIAAVAADAYILHLQYGYPGHTRRWWWPKNYSGCCYGCSHSHSSRNQANPLSMQAQWMVRCPTFCNFEKSPLWTKWFPCLGHCNHYYHFYHSRPFPHWCPNSLATVLSCNPLHIAWPRCRICLVWQQIPSWTQHWFAQFLQPNPWLFPILCLLICLRRWRSGPVICHLGIPCITSVLTDWFDLPKHYHLYIKIKPLNDEH